MELERVAGGLYRELPKNADKLDKELTRLSGVLEETAATLMVQIEKEKYKKDKDAERIKTLRKIYRSIRKEMESIEACRAQFEDVEESMTQEAAAHAEVDGQGKSLRIRSASEQRIDYDQYRVDETIAYGLDTVLTNKKPAAFSLYGRKYEAESWKAVLLGTCSVLGHIDPMLLASLEFDEELQGRKRPYFSKDGMTLDSPAKVPDADLYVETHVSARYLRKMLTKILRKFGVPLTEFQIYLKKDFTALHSEETKAQRRRSNAVAAGTVDRGDEAGFGAGIGSGTEISAGEYAGATDGPNAGAQVEQLSFTLEDLQ